MKIFISLCSGTEIATWYRGLFDGDLNRRSTALFLLNRRGAKDWLPDIEAALLSHKKVVPLDERMAAAKLLADRATKLYLPTLDKFKFSNRASIDKKDRLVVSAYTTDIGVTGKNLSSKCSEMSKQLGLDLTFILEGKTVKITVN